MQEQEFEGRTVEEAITTGLARLECPRSSVDIKILSEGTAGLFGLMGSKPARVRLTLHEKPATGADSPAAAGAQSPDLVLAQKKACEYASGIMERMGARVNSATAALIAGRVLVEIASPDKEMLIGRAGQTLCALETVLNAMLARDAHTRTKVRLDVDNYRQQRDDELQVLARRIADQVRATGAAHRFDPMSSQDRRVIHLALKACPGIEAFSEGEGAQRTVAVRPAEPAR